jgi:hypothetical protein
MFSTTSFARDSMTATFVMATFFIFCWLTLWGHSAVSVDNCATYRCRTVVGPDCANEGAETRV